MPGITITTAAGALPINGNVPNPAGLVTAVATGTTSIQITWTDDSTAAAPAQSFLIERSTDGINWTTIATTMLQPVNSTGLTAATQYTIKVTPSNFWGSGPSLTTTVTTEAVGAPSAPTNLAAIPIGPTSIGVTWTDGSNNEDNFQLQRATENTFASPTTVTPSANANAYTFTGLTAETTYYFRNRAQNTSGDSAWSSTVSATTPSAGEAEFSLTAVPDANVGITSTLSSTFSGKWIWQNRAAVFGDSGLPSIIIATHQGDGAEIYNRGSGWSYSKVTSGYGLTSSSIKSVTAGLMMADFDGDGDIDIGHFVGPGSIQNSWYYNSGTLSSGSSMAITDLSSIYEHTGGQLRMNFVSWPQYPNSLNHTLITSTWNGSAWSASSASAGFPSGIDSTTLAELAAALDDGSLNSNKRFMQIYYRYYDLTGSGSPNDLVIQVLRGYSTEPERTWLLTSNGDGTFTNRNSAWGIPTGGGVSIFPGQFGQFRPFVHNPGWIDATWADFAGTGGPDLFLSTNGTSGSYHGHYRKNGSSYTRLTSSPITARLGLADAYPKRLYVEDLTNSGYLDIILQCPRSGQVFIFVNDGSGNFTEYGQYTVWDADGMDCIDLDGDGLPDFILGGWTGADSGVSSGTTARVLSILENTTTNSGNFINFKIRRTGHLNKFGIGTTIAVHTAGQSYSAASLIQRWYARPDGQPRTVGVGNASSVDYKITEPNGTVTNVTGVTVSNQTITFTG